VDFSYMTSDQNKLIIRRYIEEIVNTGNVGRIGEFVSADYVEVYRGVRSAVGPDGAREHVLGVRRTYPDLHLTIDRQIAEGEWVVTQVTAKGTHLGSWLGMRPTGKAVEITAVNVDRVVGGRIVEHGGAANSLEALLEIGAVRVVGTERDAEPGGAANRSQPVGPEANRTSPAAGSGG
jgi:predicted ester cyclase